jgi:hypothetical protein
MDCACVIERVFATLGGKLFRIALAKFHKACAVGPAGHPLDAPNSARTDGLLNQIRSWSEPHTPDIRDARMRPVAEYERGFGSIGLELAAARPMSGDVPDEQRPDRWVLTGLKAAFSADHGAAAAGLGVANLGVA